MTEDKEIESMSSMAKTMAGLDDEQTGRVLRWLTSRYGGKAQGKPLLEEDAAPPTERTFDDIADFMDASGVSINDDRALAAAYYVQELEGRSTFGSQTVNSHLKHLGHPAANITKTFNRLMKKTPALLMQTKKAGTSQQARKQYKLTTAGVKTIQGMLGDGMETEE